MRVWVEDLKYHVVIALRAVGVGLIAVAWASALTSEAQQVTDTRAYIQVAAALAVLLTVHIWTRLPPSWTVCELLAPLARDIAAVARERCLPEAALRRAAAMRLRRGANVPVERRLWLSRLVEAYEAREKLQMDQPRHADT